MALALLNRQFKIFTLILWPIKLQISSLLITSHTWKDYCSVFTLVNLAWLRKRLIVFSFSGDCQCQLEQVVPKLNFRRSRAMSSNFQNCLWRITIDFSAWLIINFVYGWSPRHKYLWSKNVCVLVGYPVTNICEVKIIVDGWLPRDKYLWSNKYCIWLVTPSQIFVK